MWLYVHSTLSESYLAVVVLNWKILYARILVSMRNFLYLILWQFATELSRERFLFVETCMVKLLAIFVLHLLCLREEVRPTKSEITIFDFQNFDFAKYVTLWCKTHQNQRT
jgi:hypothetical protein